LIIEMIPVGPFGTNCYVVGSEPTLEGMIIDPGDEAGKIMGVVGAKKLNIKVIVLTHGHIDHVTALPKVKEATGAPVAIHTADAGFLQGGRRDSVMGFQYPEVTVDRLLQGGDKITVGGLDFLVLHTPGHTSGGISLLGPGVVFTGDALFNSSIGRTDFPGGSQTQLLASIHTKLMVLPDSTVVYSGHGPASTIGAERRGNPFLRGM
jgi:glyoxylase-like metal-dependent hydrolase (beta-lactamase superfamily II)